MSINPLDFIGLFLCIAGLIVGLGAVTVIDIHGFLARKSSYWTETTIRVHKVTKPLIWLGIVLLTWGGLLFYRENIFDSLVLMHGFLIMLLILNGIFLSFIISPQLLKKEKAGKAKELFESTLQLKVIGSLFFSFIGWWGTVLLLVWSLLSGR